MPPRRRTKRRKVAGKGRKGKTETWQEYLKRIYYDPSHAASFQGVSKLYEQARKEGKYPLKKEQVKEWLQEQEPYSLHKSVKREFRRGEVVVAGIDDQFEADLVSLVPYSEENDGTQYLLAVIDNFSRYAWAEPLTNKTADDTIRAFKKIFAQGRVPKKVRSDRGREFTAASVRQFFQDKGIRQIFTGNEKQANYAERFIKTLKNKLFRYMTHNRTDRYIDVLPKLVRSYNNTFHKGIREVPSNVDTVNEKKLWWQQYWPSEPYDPKKRAQMRKPVQFAYKEGDLVRISHLRSAFKREYDNKWTGEVFKVRKRFIRRGRKGSASQPIYKIEDLKGEELEGSFYQSELQKVNLPESALFTIEDELKKRTRGGKRQVLVKFRYYPAKFNEWINEEDIVSL